MSAKLHRFNAWTQSYHSSQCRKSTACLSDSRNLLSTRAVRLSVHLMCRNSRCFPWRQKETHMAGHWSCHHRPGSWPLYRHITTRRWCTLDNLVMWLQITPVAILLINRSTAVPSLSLLTQLLTADSIAKAGADHLLTTLTPEPTLSIVVGGSRVCAACSLHWLYRRASSMDWGNHNSTRGCKQPNEVKIKSQLGQGFSFCNKM